MVKEYCKDKTQPVVRECPDCVEAFMDLAYAKEERLAQAEPLAEAGKEVMKALKSWLPTRGTIADFRHFEAVKKAMVEFSQIEKDHKGVTS